jgi:hypothetical protein
MFTTKSKRLPIFTISLFLKKGSKTIYQTSRESGYINDGYPDCQEKGDALILN